MDDRSTRPAAGVPLSELVKGVHYGGKGNPGKIETGCEADSTARFTGVWPQVHIGRLVAAWNRLVPR